MSKFELNKPPEVQELTELPKIPIQPPVDSRILRASQAEIREPVIAQYSFGKVGRSATSYAEKKAAHGALARTDSEISSRERKDQRFHLNEMSRGTLGVDDEERRVIEAQVQEKVESIREEVKAKAKIEGYEEGLKQGFQEAFRQFQKDATMRLERFDSLLQEAESAKAEIFRANEGFLIELVFQIGRMVLLRELSADKEYVLRLARELLDRVGVRENIHIRVNPQDFETIGMLKEGLENQLGALKNISIEASTEVDLGGCALETKWDTIDASVGTQLAAIADTLRSEALRSNG